MVCGILPHHGSDDCPYPIWVELKSLPLEYFHPSFLRAIGDSLGKFLRMDDSTRCLTRPDTARICVEMDIFLEMPDRLWIELNDTKGEGFWQPISYPGFQYCSSCSIFGHTLEACRKKPRQVNEKKGKEKS